MRARDVLRRRVDLVLEKNRYKKALEQITRLNEFDPNETTGPEVDDAISIAKRALRKPVTP